MNHEYQKKWLGQAGLQITQALEDAWPFRYEVAISHGVFDGVGYVYIRTANPLNLAEIGNPGGGQNEYPYSLNIAISWPEEDLIRYLDCLLEEQLQMLPSIGRIFGASLLDAQHPDVSFNTGRQMDAVTIRVQLDDFDR